MEIFTISCTTCQQRLKVHDESAIGEIEICPKCGSMVLVEPPANWRSDSASETPPAVDVVSPPIESPPASDRESYDEELDRETVVDPFPASDFSDVPLSSETMKAPNTGRESSSATAPGGEDASRPPEGSDEQPEVASVPPESSERPPDESREEESSTPADDAESRVDSSSQSDSEQPASAEPILPTDVWTSESARQRKQLLLIVGAAIVGVTLAIGLLGFFASRAVRRNVAENGGEVTVSQDEPSPGSVDNSPPQPDPVEENETGPDRAVDTEDPPESVEDTDDPEATVDPPAEPLLAPEADPGTPQPSEAGTDDPAHDPPDSPASDPAPVPDPEVTPPEEMPSDPTEDAPATDAAILAATIDAFAPFIETEQPPPSPADGATAGTPAEFDPGALVHEPTVARPKPRPVNLDARMADRIPRVQFPDVPLLSFVRFLSEYSTIPMTIDTDALALVRVSPQDKVTVQADDVDVRTLLDRALQPLGLSHVKVDSQLVVTRAWQADDQLREVQHPADDLAEDELQLQELADRIVEMIEPDSWDTRGGTGVIRAALPAIVIQQRDTVLFRTIVFCERIRAARGLPPRTNFNPAQFSLTPRFQRADKQLAKSLTLNYIQPTRFGRILDMLAQEADVSILVDWLALSEAGWNSDAEVTLSALNEPLSAALDRLLHPMALVYRVVDETTLQVTTVEGLTTRLDIEFYPLDGISTDPEADDQVLEAITKNLGEQTVRGVRGTLYLDRPSRRLVAALPQPYQRRLAELLKGSL